jgi:hypothetical protein
MADRIIVHVLWALGAIMLVFALRVLLETVRLAAVRLFCALTRRE